MLPLLLLLLNILKKSNFIYNKSVTLNSRLVEILFFNHFIQSFLSNLEKGKIVVIDSDFLIGKSDLFALESFVLQCLKSI